MNADVVPNRLAGEGSFGLNRPSRQTRSTQLFENLVLGVVGRRSPRKTSTTRKSKVSWRKPGSPGDTRQVARGRVIDQGLRSTRESHVLSLWLSYCLQLVPSCRQAARPEPLCLRFDMLIPSLRTPLLAMQPEIMRRKARGQTVRTRAGDVLHGQCREITLARRRLPEPPFADPGQGRGG